MTASVDGLQDYVAGEVRAEFARSRMSLREGARRLGWTQTFLWRRAMGEIGFEVTELARIAELLDVPIEKFLPRPANKTGAGSIIWPFSSPLRTAA